MEAVQAFPKKADRIHTEAGMATLVKTDIFKQLMFYSYVEGRNRGKLYALKVEQVKEIQLLNKKGEKPMDLGLMILADMKEEEVELDYEDVTGVIELPPEQRRKKKRKNRRKKPSGDKGDQKKGEASTAQPKKEDSERKAKPKSKPKANAETKGGEQAAKAEDNKEGGNNRNRNRRRNRRRNKNKGGDKGNNNNNTNADS